MYIIFNFTEVRKRYPPLKNQTYDDELKPIFDFNC